MPAVPLHKRADLFGSASLPLKRGTRWKIAAIKTLSHCLDIPINVHEEALPEVMRSAIDTYIEECCYLLRHVYDATESTVAKFHEWAYDYMLSNMYSPLLLHDHPLYYAGRYLGIDHLDYLDYADGTVKKTENPRYYEAERRFTELAQTNEDYKKRFMDGWRVSFRRQSFTDDADHKSDNL